MVGNKNVSMSKYLMEKLEVQVYYLKYPTFEIHIFHCISQYLNFPLLSSDNNAGSIFEKERQFQILGQYSGRYVFQKSDA